MPNTERQRGSLGCAVGMFAWGMVSAYRYWGWTGAALMLCGFAAALLIALRAGSR